MAFLLLRQQALARAPRVFKPRLVVENLSDAEIIDGYRVSREMLGEIVGGFSDSEFANKTNRSHALLPQTQVLLTLRYLAQGGSYEDVAAIHGVSRSTVCRCIDSVTSYICSLAPMQIAYPNTRRELDEIAAGFHTVAGMPSTIGAIDGSHINILAPTENEIAYVNRKNDHSINVQAVCDANLVFLDLEVRWPGSTHDAFMWQMSFLRAKMGEALFNEYWLLGDSGYPCTPRLHTPILHPANAAQARFNSAHCRTRSVIERAFGVLKSRFRCLHKSGGILQQSVRVSCKIITTCAVLHNMCRRARLPDPQLVDFDRDVFVENGLDPDNAQGVQVRLAVIRNRFDI